MEVRRDCETCPHSTVEYEEWDTGYKEFGCSLMGKAYKFYASYDSCPLCYNLKVEFEGE